MTDLYITFGPPGTGKTRWATEQIEKAAVNHGPENIMAASHTRAAAIELISRDLAIPRDNVGTLHSLCYRLLDRPRLAEKDIDLWNKEFPHYAISNQLGKASVDDLEGGMESFGETVGDDLLHRYNLLRARMIDRKAWPGSVANFATVFEEWKEREARYDFTDLLEATAERFVSAPGRPEVAFIDEAQDLSALQMSLVMTWAKNMKHVVLIGDDDQAIYSFAGADVRNLLKHNVDDKHRLFLRQSYRLPVKIQELANIWISQIKERQDKIFRPRESRGRVERLPDGYHYKNADDIIDWVKNCVPKEETVMFLGSCSYHVAPLISVLRDRCMAFHNPFRVSRGDWNPLSRREGGMPNRLFTFLSGIRKEPPTWTYSDFKLWADLLDSNRTLHRGSKKRISELAEQFGDEKAGFEDWVRFFKDRDYIRENGLSIEWLLDHATEAKKKALAFPASVMMKGGEVSAVDPKIIVGTIHSVKGGEADHVVLLPDLSRSATDQWVAGGRARENIIRTFYVGMTRARNSLTIASPLSGQWAVSI